MSPSVKTAGLARFCRQPVRNCAQQAAEFQSAAAIGSISNGSLFLTFPTRLSTGQTTMSLAG